MSDRSVSTDEHTSAQPGNSLQNSYEWSNVPPSLAAVDTVAEAVGRDPTALDSLYDAVDPDALDKQFQREYDAPANDLRVSFVYHGYHVVVRDDGVVTATPIDSPGEVY